MATRKRAANGRRRGEEDALEVLCRLTPYNGPDPCLVVDQNDENIVKVIPPAGMSQRNGQPYPIRQFQFGHVFDDNESQKKIFDRSGVDMVNHLITGRNGLLFTYGVTGSGKSFTMAGNSKKNNAGILPRVLDCVFNSVENRVDKCVFRPNGRNSFEVLSEHDAMLARRECDRRLMDSSQEIADRGVETKRVDGFNYNYVCAIFISYVEIYNNYVYDLLEDSDTPVRRETRTDLNGMTYVEGVNEIEVESADEALEMFVRGEERRRTSDTLLNKESSRSHSVFSIRLVQAPSASDNDYYPTNDLNMMVISQLSLVDLAGSERAKRTMNVGERLAEAGSINNSLLVLRRCLEKLRTNQRRQTPEPIPFRDSKLTTLFKNYFDGSMGGKIRMIICANPKPDDYEENLNVLSFAEESQSVKVVRGEVLLVDSGPRPPIPKKFFSKWNIEADRIDPGSSMSLAPSTIPTFDEDDDRSMSLLREWAHRRHEERNQHLQAMNQSMCNLEPLFRSSLCVNDYRSIEIEELKKQKAEDDWALSRALAELKQAKREIASLRSRLSRYELEDAQMVDAEEELRRGRKQDRDRLRKQSRTLQQVRDICENVVPVSSVTPSVSVAQLRHRFTGTQDDTSVPSNNKKLGSAANTLQAFPSSIESRRHDREGRQKENLAGPGFYNHKYKQRRSKSAPRVLDHQPNHRIPSGSILKAKLPPNTKQTINPDAQQLHRSTEYVLTHQEVDKEGNLSTSIVKGAIIPTAAGGSAVTFNDVERLTHENPQRGK